MGNSTKTKIKKKDYNENKIHSILTISCEASNKLIAFKSSIILSTLADINLFCNYIYK